jgi:hypothetical protein
VILLQHLPPLGRVLTQLTFDQSPRRSFFFLVNLAVTDFAPVIDTLHVVASPVQAPDQPAKVELFVAVALSVTWVPVA